MKLKRISRDDVEAPVIALIYNKALKFPLDGQWRKIDEVIPVLGRRYHLSVIYKLTGKYLTYKNLEVKSVNQDKIILN